MNQKRMFPLWEYPLFRSLSEVYTKKNGKGRENNEYRV